MAGRHPRYDYLVGQLQPVRLTEEWRILHRHLQPLELGEVAEDDEGGYSAPFLAPSAAELDPAGAAASTTNHESEPGAGRWTLAEFRRARANGQQAFTQSAEFQAETDALNRWAVLGLCLTEGRRPFPIPQPRVQHSANTPAEAEEEEDCLQAEIDVLNHSASRR